MSEPRTYKPIPDDIQAIACIPCVEGMAIGYSPYKNSLIKPCSQCDVKVWVGPKSWDLHRTSNIPIVCVYCLAAEYGPEAVYTALQPLTSKKTGE